MGQPFLYDENQTEFPGRISRLNEVASLMRVRVDFENMKFVNKGEKLQFWQEHDPKNRCRGEVMGKTPMYFLIRIFNYGDCLTRVQVTTGASLRFYGENLDHNIRTAKELIDILLKKRLALHSKLSREDSKLAKFNEKIDIVNKRYRVLYHKLEAERLKEVEHLKKDQMVLFEMKKDSERRLRDVMKKLEQYKVEDRNFKIDRWSLDPNLYYLK